MSRRGYKCPNGAVKATTRFEIANQRRDIDHGLIFQQKKVEITNGHTPSQVFVGAADADNANFEFSRPNATEPHEDNGIKISNFREAAKVTKYGKAKDFMTCMVRWSHPDDFDTPCIKVMPYKRIYPSPYTDSYPAGMVFEFKCPYFYPGGLAEVKKMEMKRANSSYVQDKSGPEWTVLGWK